MNSIDTITTIKKISFLFFMILGLIHFASGLLSAKSYFIPVSTIAMQISFIPFVLAGIAYLYGIIKEHLMFNGKYGKGIDYAFIACGAIILIGLLVIQFALPDAISPNI